MDRLEWFCSARESAQTNFCSAETNSEFGTRAIPGICSQASSLEALCISGLGTPAPTRRRWQCWPRRRLAREQTFRAELSHCDPDRVQEVPLERHCRWRRQFQARRVQQRNRMALDFAYSFRPLRTHQSATRQYSLFDGTGLTGLQCTRLGPTRADSGGSTGDDEHRKNQGATNETF